MFNPTRKIGVLNSLATITRRLKDSLSQIADPAARVFAALAIGLSVLLPLLNLWLIAAFPDAAKGILPALVATTIAVPLHIRHVVYGIRGERPPNGPATLAALAVVNIVAAFLVGPDWLFNFASLAVSVLIVLRGPPAILLFCAVVLAPVVIIHIPGFADPELPLPETYLALAVLWRAITLYVPVRLVAAIGQLEHARRELMERAVVRERLNIDAELRQTLGATLEGISRSGERAVNALDEHPPTAKEQLAEMVSASRRALSEVRRMVAGYQAVSARAELQAAIALLEATGASTTLVVAHENALDNTDERSRTAVREAFVQALRNDHAGNYLVEVSLLDSHLKVSVSPPTSATKAAATS